MRCIVPNFNLINNEAQREFVQNHRQKVNLNKFFSI